MQCINTLFLDYKTDTRCTRASTHAHTHTHTQAQSQSSKHANAPPTRDINKRGDATAHTSTLQIAQKQRWPLDKYDTTPNDTTAVTTDTQTAGSVKQRLYHDTATHARRGWNKLKFYLVNLTSERTHRAGWAYFKTKSLHEHTRRKTPRNRYYYPHIEQ